MGIVRGTGMTASPGWKCGAVYAITDGMLGAIASYYVGGFLGEGLLDE